VPMVSELSLPWLRESRGRRRFMIILLSLERHWLGEGEVPTVSVLRRPWLGERRGRLSTGLLSPHSLFLRLGDGEVPTVKVLLLPWLLDLLMGAHLLGPLLPRPLDLGVPSL
jgi:hypothetical protein